MAVTVTNAADQPSAAVPSGSQREWCGKITFDSSYPTGGETLTAADFGLQQIRYVSTGNTQSGKNVCWDPATGKLKLFATYATEATNASDQSTETVECRVIGI